MIKLSHELGKRPYSAEDYITKQPSNTVVSVTTDDNAKTYKANRAKKKSANSPKKPHGYGDISSAYNAKRTKEADERKETLKKAIANGDIKTVEDGAEYLNVSVSTVHRYLSDLKIKLKSH